MALRLPACSGKMLPKCPIGMLLQAGHVAGSSSVGLGADELRQILSWSVFDGIPGIFGELRVE